MPGQCEFSLAKPSESNFLYDKRRGRVRAKDDPNLKAALPTVVSHRPGPQSA
jgi:hypothetical protein